MKIEYGSHLKRTTDIRLAGVIVLSGLFFLLSRVGPPWLSSNNPEKNLDRLRTQKAAIQSEFGRVLDSFRDKHERLSASGIPDNTQDRFAFLKSLCSEPESEGVAYHDEYTGDVELWYGQFIYINPIFEEARDIDPSILEPRSTLLISHRSSIFLISTHELFSGAYVVFYRLLAFLPEFKARYLQDRHFINRSLMARIRIFEYHDFREDISGTEEFFSRNNDEYVGQPLLQGDIQTLYFPLRNEKNRIVATVTLESPSLSARRAAQKENLLLLAYACLAAALVWMLLRLIRTAKPESGSRQPRFIFLVILLMAGLRAVFILVSRLERIRDLQMFSPAEIGFITWGSLTGSPADLCLTALVIFLSAGLIFFWVGGQPQSERPPRSAAASLIFSIGAGIAALAALWGLYELLRRMVVHSSFSLLVFSFRPSFLLVHLGIFFFCSVLLLMGMWAFRSAIRAAPGRHTLPVVSAGLYLLYILAFLSRIPLPVLLLQGALGALLVSACYAKDSMWQRRLRFLVFASAILLVYAILNGTDNQKKHAIVQDSLKDTVLSQEEWGRFYIQQSIEHIEDMERKRGGVTAVLQGARIPDFARELWRGTLLAKANWDSSLELLSPQGGALSQFSLNIPEPYRPEFDLPISPDWRILPRQISYWSKEKDFLIAYRDWFHEENYLGRSLLTLSVDYTILPFLYSANPYYELLRIASYPSLNQIELGFAVVDTEGKYLFNPYNISSGIPLPLLQDILNGEDHIWTEFKDKDRVYSALMFPHKGRVYAILLARKSLLRSCAEFLELFLLYSAFLVGAALGLNLGSARKNLKNLFWSFSNRVYLVFVIIALIPLLLFSVFTQNFFSRVYAQKITEEAESHANFAHRVMEEFIQLQQEGQQSLTIPPEVLLIWISNTIAHDVNLYLDGRVYSSSHREFFEYGLLPEFIDGEIFYKIQYENHPLYTQTQRIGEYAFHTLTIPYYLEDNFLLISLPFPLEEQRVSRTTADLLEFLFLLSMLFILVVLLFGRAAGTTVTSPIRKLLAGTKAVGLGNLEISIPYRRDDEMKTLVNGFNDMVKSLKQHQQELADVSKKVAWAEMARKVAHEIKNPLTPIQLSAEHLLRVYEERPEEFEQALKESTTYIVTEVEHLRRIAQEFLETSKEAVLQRERLDLRKILQETLEPYRKILAERIRFNETYKGEGFTFSGDVAKIKIVLRNILTNSIESIPEQGRIDVTLSTSGSQLQVEISDTGCGLEPEMMDRIFEPYFSTKDVGTGLGLPIAKKIIEDHGGTIQAHSNQPQGLQIRITLPKA